MAVLRWPGGGGQLWGQCPGHEKAPLLQPSESFWNKQHAWDSDFNPTHSSTAACHPIIASENTQRVGITSLSILGISQALPS